MKRRVLTIALALVLAIAGSGVVLAYVKGANARAVAGLKAVTVLVAQKEIPAGTSAGAAWQGGLLRGETLPAQSVPAEAVGSITADLDSLVMSSEIMPGQVLLRPMLVRAAQASGGLAIPAGLVAVTIPLCLPQAVAGYVQAGSQVAIFDTRMVLPKVQVLSMSGGTSGQGGSGTGAASQTQGSVLVTLAVDQADAERVIQVAETGLPYLALLTPDSQTGFDTTTQSLFQQ
jgi:pilus assembly protein CpaB